MTVDDADSSPTELDVLLLPAFAADDFSAEEDLPDEFRPWLDAYEFSNETSVPGANAPVFHTDDGVGITATGMGKADAAATLTAVLAHPELDCSNAYFLTVGIAGVRPDVGTLGSVFIADAVVDWDRKHRFPDRDDGAPVELLGYRPHDYVLRLNEALVAEAYRSAKGVELLDSERARRYRNRYAQDAARSKPTVATGTTLCGDEFWHGTEFSEQAQWLADEYDAGVYATTEMEDFGTATALDRFGLLHRYLSVRGAANFDQPPEGVSARESLREGVGPHTVELGLENAVRVGSRVVEAIRSDRERFERGR
ncbi:purine nucleoside permease [Haladaptatus salinisoli]|uniref:purine nucleoside permease n=1 Tax=Haladaptatus salinisoli TaxID=2884876 RepID=UPI001D0B6682|nr:purine nucleoside permease [Haladaptatus salinisoli]